MAQRDELLDLASALLELREQGLTTDYNRLWRACTDGRVPAQRCGRSWRIQRQNLPAVATALGARASFAA